MNLHLVTMENGKQDFKYVLGVFNSPFLAETAAKYELERRRCVNMPGEVTPRISKVEVDKLYNTELNVHALDAIFHNRT